MGEALSPRQAVRALEDVGRYEEELGARTGGITTMVWGIVSAAIFLAYGTGAPYAEATGRRWILPLLWIPWVAAGILTTSALWHSHAVTFRKDPGAKRNTWLSLGFAALFLVIAGGLLGLLAVSGIGLEVNGLMTAANGLLALAMGVLMRSTWPGCLPLLGGAGAILCIAGIALGMAHLDQPLAALVAAVVCGASWVAVGLLGYRSG